MAHDIDGVTGRRIVGATLSLLEGQSLEPRIPPLRDTAAAEQIALTLKGKVY